jgi:hypothetical protein
MAAAPKEAATSLRWSSTGAGRGSLTFKGCKGNAFLIKGDHGNADTVLGGSCTQGGCHSCGQSGLLALMGSSVAHERRRHRGPGR